IIFISSLSASLGVKGTLAYSASKASIDSSVKVLANELSRYNIRVNSIAPGIIKTPLLENQVFDNEKLASEQEKYPLGFGDCKDVAYSAHFLLSKASKWITGSVIELNGGYKLN
ncbi:SDR family oxidoreductase, partial [Flavobacteriaceae bacterium]|nr:SDR family oxidoreductase [Flavobacteriaceae bacterium]